MLVGVLTFMLVSLETGCGIETGVLLSSRHQIWLIFWKTFQDLHLALVANSEYTVGIGDSRGSTKWVLNEVGLEQHIVDK